MHSPKPGVRFTNLGAAAEGEVAEAEREEEAIPNGCSSSLEAGQMAQVFASTLQTQSKTFRDRCRVFAFSRGWSIVDFIATIISFIYESVLILLIPKSLDWFWAMVAIIVCIIFLTDLILMVYTQRRAYMKTLLFFWDFLATLSMVISVLYIFGVLQFYRSWGKMVSFLCTTARIFARMDRLLVMMRKIRSGAFCDSAQKIVEADIDRFLKTCDPLNTGIVSYTQFVDACNALRPPGEEQVDGDLIKKFWNLSCGPDGDMTIPDLKRVYLRVLGEKVDMAMTHSISSLVGKRMIYKVKTKVVVGFFLMLAVVQIICSWREANEQRHAQPILAILQADMSYQSVTALTRYYGDKLVLLQFTNALGPYSYINQELMDSKRRNELLWITYQSGTLVLDNTASLAFHCALELVTTIFLSGLLTIGNWLLVRNIKKDLVGPLEHMVEIVDEMKQNPLRDSYAPMTSHTTYETALVLTSLQKIGWLLKAGFGAAGAETITRNLSHTGMLQQVFPGVRVRGIFTFCDIRNFTDMTEYFQENVMLFVNEVAKCVHEACVETGGSPNKNVGDAFFVVWKQGAKKSAQEMAMGALMSWLKASVMVETAPQMCNMARSIGVGRVCIGIGIHHGWAIEGAVGTHHKIDSSYLSPHVNLAARLESATKTYGVSLLMSAHFVKHLPEATSKYLRKIDKVVLKGFKGPGLSMYSHNPTIFTAPQFQDLWRQPEKTTPKLAFLPTATYRTPLLPRSSLPAMPATVPPSGGGDFGIDVTPPGSINCGGGSDNTPSLVRDGSDRDWNKAPAGSNRRRGSAVTLGIPEREPAAPRRSSVTADMIGRFRQSISGSPLRKDPFRHFGSPTSKRMDSSMSPLSGNKNPLPQWTSSNMDVEGPCSGDPPPQRRRGSGIPLVPKRDGEEMQNLGRRGSNGWPLNEQRRSSFSSLKGVDDRPRQIDGNGPIINPFQRRDSGRPESEQDAASDSETPAGPGRRWSNTSLGSMAWEPTGNQETASCLPPTAFIGIHESIEPEMLMQTSSNLEWMDTDAVYQYHHQWSDGLQAYLEGNWSQAKKILQSCSIVSPQDTPVKVILHFMDSLGGCPRKWPGFRKLANK